MTTPSNTQSLILSRAATRPGNLALPLPEGLVGAAAKMVVGKMIACGWLEEVVANLRRCEPLWRETGDGQPRPSFWVPKLGDPIESDILSKVLSVSTKVSHLSGRSNHRVYYRTTGGLYWKVFTDFPPAFNINGVPGSSSRETTFSVPNKAHVKPLIGVLSSGLFWWWYTITSNLRDLNPADIQGFPVPETAMQNQSLAILSAEYLDELRENSTMLVRQQKSTGRTETQSFKIQKSKQTLDKIDALIGPMYGLTPSEVDFIINYDLKFRMGGGDDGSDE